MYISEQTAYIQQQQAGRTQHTTAHMQDSCKWKLFKQRQNSELMPITKWHTSHYYNFLRWRWMSEIFCGTNEELSHKLRSSFSTSFRQLASVLVHIIVYLYTCWQSSANEQNCLTGRYVFNMYIDENGQIQAKAAKNILRVIDLYRYCNVCKLYKDMLMQKKLIWQKSFDYAI